MDFELLLPEEEKIKEEIIAETKPTDKETIELVETANNYANKLINIDLENLSDRVKGVEAIENLGLDLQKQAVHKSSLLQSPIKEIADKGKEGHEVSNTLVSLRNEIKELDPTSIDFEKKGFLGKFFNPVTKYFQKYKKSETLLNDILKSLDNGQDILKRDNISLGQEQIDMRELTKKIRKTIKMGEAIDISLNKELENVENQDKARFIQEELIFPLRQRIMDLQQQLAVNQQGILAIEVLMRNNKELIRGVNRAKLVTVNALKVAIIVAKALADQKLVLDQINALNETTNNLIAGTAERLKNQGVEIQKQASGSMIDVEKLKEAFVDINNAMEQISTYRKEALPRMAESIVEFDKLTREGEERIKRLEKGNLASASSLL